MTVTMAAALLWGAAALVVPAGTATSHAQTPDRDGGGSQRREPRIALVIGNSDYRTAPLRNPVNDARAMAQVLRGVGFDVLAHENVDFKAMRGAVRDFGARLAGGGVGLFYYAGHGLQVAGRNYMVPVDAHIRTERDVEVEAVDVASVLAQMDVAKNRLNIVVLDACRDNPYARSFRSQARGLASIDAPSGTLIAYSTAPGQVALDGSGANGVYTGELVKAIQVPGMRVEDVFKRTRQEVQRLTQGQQVSWESSSLVGEFTFTITTTVTIRPGPPAATGPVVDRSEQMMVVPEAAFVMGSSPSDVAEAVASCMRLGQPDKACRSMLESELPSHRVTLSAFLIDRYEVTNVQFKRFVDTTGHVTTAERDGHGSGERVVGGKWQLEKIEGASWRTPNGPGSEAKAEHPVVQVSWHDAVAYCNWAGKRLPTEAEWEKAARGTDARRYPWGNTWDNTKANGAWASVNTLPVGTHPKGASPYGAHDMAGNVWEWVSDWHSADYYARSPQRDPQGPEEGAVKGLRGGSWQSAPVWSRSARRGGREPLFRADYVGFRCVKAFP